jgi:uncharacterized protein YndB with AHSA1/START domain
MKKEALRVSTTIPAAPTTLYLAWLSAEQHGAMTSSTAKIDSQVGGKFQACNGYISGKIVVLDLGRRIIMSWRTTDFPRDAADSRVEIHFEALGGSTRLTILHTEIPEGQGEKYRVAWNDNYFVPMRTHFSKYLPDPRKPPPPRRPIPPEDDEEEEEAPKRKGKALKGAPPPAKGKAAAQGKPPPPSKKPAAAPPSKRPASPPSKKPAPPAPKKPAAAAAKKPAATKKKPAAATGKKPAAGGAKKKK